MRKKKNKKKFRKKLFKFMIFILIITGITVFIMNIKVKNIYVTGNYLLSDQEIIELAGLENYPRLFENTSLSIEKKLKLNQYIDSVKVRKNLFGRVNIEVKEYKMLLKNEIDNTVYLSNFKTLPTDNELTIVPTLINSVPEDILKTFLEKLNEIDTSMLEHISEVEYTPDKYYKDLFLLYMRDGNYIYVTPRRLKYINKYDEVLQELNGQKGIWNLYDGSHVEKFS